ncbi:hypothetical protein HQQ82_14320 [Rathayibacter sp. VKM Ac-2856]|uniref:hypothetical protein n=1 Tax=unclassified Rathayibacter TaxID=2609250 RepID=UPI00156430CB|nr:MULTISPECIES: hypothetical protein [unclassified Rathayibacter]NQX05897.1 hypothetical protein [Rathayibacter sp. VKM Ac-2858]NQX21153.1 hypothetical protein [Rathayibacter sp. VKM Ac-2856]
MKHPGSPESSSPGSPDRLAGLVLVLVILVVGVALSLGTDLPAVVRIGVSASCGAIAAAITHSLRRGRGGRPR